MISKNTNIMWIYKLSNLIQIQVKCKMRTHDLMINFLLSYSPCEGRILDIKRIYQLSFSLQFLLDGRVWSCVWLCSRMKSHKWKLDSFMASQDSWIKIRSYQIFQDFNLARCLCWYFNHFWFWTGTALAIIFHD